MNLFLRFVREALAAAVCGSLCAVLWLSLGNLWTWAVDARVQVLGASAAVAIVVPAFVLGWCLFLVRRTVLVSRRRLVVAAALSTTAGSLLHRVVYFDETGANVADAGFIDGLERALAVVARVVMQGDVRWLTDQPAAYWSMALAAVTAASIIAAVAYRPIAVAAGACSGVSLVGGRDRVRSASAA